jgi:hypothetical protein
LRRYSRLLRAEQYFDRRGWKRQQVEIVLACLATAAHILRIPADYEDLCCAFPSSKADELPLILLRAAKKLGIKAKLITTTIDRLDKLPSQFSLFLAILRSQISDEPYLNAARPDAGFICVRHCTDIVVPH